uniref:Uncharacterized protein n=1 Tax=Acrobeloides nanus TaxID=290746 RepID=A0A914CCI0_9BILA
MCPSYSYVLLTSTVFLAIISQVLSECCVSDTTSEFCIAYNVFLTPAEQAEVRKILGEKCEGDVQEAVKEKRKPNFIRFGKRSVPGTLPFGKKGSDPNFLRFGRSAPANNFLRFGKSPSQQNFLRFGKRNADPNFLRFGRANEDSNNFVRLTKSADPNFLRFGKRSSLNEDSAEPNFLRFGRNSNNFLRFGRAAEKFDQQNFLRFG